MKQVDILIYKNQALQILYHLANYNNHLMGWVWANLTIVNNFVGLTMHDKKLTKTIADWNCYTSS